jgi:hypothetical protein
MGHAVSRLEINRHGSNVSRDAEWVGAIAWPKSALMEIGYGVVPAVTFVWLGVLVYLLIRVDVLRELSPVRLLWACR